MLGRVMDPHTLQLMIQVCKYMAPIADIFWMPSTYVPTTHNLGGIGVTNETVFSSEAKLLSPPQLTRARTWTAGSEERTPGGKSAEAKLLFRDIQRKQQIQQLARSAEVED